MYVEEHVAVLFGLKDAAAVQTAADDLERLHEVVLDGGEFKLVDLFHMDLAQYLGRVALDDIAVLVEVEGRQQRGMVADRGTHGVRHLFHIEQILVHAHHGVEVVHRRLGRVELIIHHVQLLDGQRMIDLHRACVLDFGRFAVVVGVIFFIKRRDLLRRSAAEDLAGVQTGQTAFGDDLDGAEGVAAELIEVVVDADLVELEHRRHRVAQLLLHFVLRSHIVGFEVGGVGLGQGFSVHLAVGLERNLVDLDVVRRDHVIGKALGEFLAHFVGVDFHVVDIVGAEEALAVLVKAARSRPVDAESRLDRSLDLGGLDAVAVDLDHIAGAAEQDIVAVCVYTREVAGVINAVLERLFGFLGQVDIAAHEGIFKAQLADLAVLGDVAFLVKEGDLGFDLGLADRAGVVGLVDLENADRESAFGSGVDVDQIDVLVVDVVRRLTADKEHAQEGTGGVAEHAHVGGGEEGDGDALLKEEALERHRVLDGGVADDEHFAAVNTQRLEDNDDRSDKVQRRQQGDSVLVGEGNLAVDADGVDRSLEVAVLVQHALGVAGGTGGVDRIRRVVVVGLLVTGERLGVHDFFPVAGGDL